MINKFKRFLSTNLFTKKIYVFFRALYYKKETLRKFKKQVSIQKNGIQTIKFLQEILKNQNAKFFFDMGTLLGIIREGRLLKHDMDIDIAVYPDSEESVEEIKKIMQENGCFHKFRYMVDDIGIVEDSYVLNNIKFDLSYYRTENGKDVCYLAYKAPEKTYQDNQLSTVKLSCDEIDNTKEIEFEGFMINVPFQPEYYLAQRYGENWTVPDKGYVYWQGPSTAPIDNITQQIKM